MKIRFFDSVRLGSIGFAISSEIERNRTLSHIFWGSIVFDYRTVRVVTSGLLDTNFIRPTLGPKIAQSRLKSPKVALSRLFKNPLYIVYILIVNYVKLNIVYFHFLLFIYS